MLSLTGNFAILPEFEIAVQCYTQHYLFYVLYPIKQTFLSARIAKLAETFNG